MNTTRIFTAGHSSVIKIPPELGLYPGELLAKLPSPEEILALHPSETLQNQIQGLLEKSRTNGLITEEEQQWQQYEYLEHLVRLAKTHAILKLQR